MSFGLAASSDPSDTIYQDERYNWIKKSNPLGAPVLAYQAWK
jgi:hypothetical protein